MIYDLRQYKPDLKCYRGANGSKISLIIDGERYMVKYPAHTKINKAISYSNSIISEYIGSHIFNILGIPAQETFLGIYTGKDNLPVHVVACKDFECDGYTLMEFAAIKNTVVDTTTGGYDTDLEEIYDSFTQQRYFNIGTLKKFFWDMFVVDAYLGNFDRHNGNWGALVNLNTQDIKFAPIFDCGSCLFAEADVDLRNKIMNNINELKLRIFTYPRSAIKLNNKKLSYLDFLSSGYDIDSITSLKEITAKINEKEPEINAMIDDIEIINDIEKSFYKFMLNKRKEMILDKALDNLDKHGILDTNNYNEL